MTIEILEDDGFEKSLHKIQKCDFCKKPAKFDAKTSLGPWAFLCQEHFTQYGVALGLGWGQRITREK